MDDTLPRAASPQVPESACIAMLDALVSPRPSCPPMPPSDLLRDWKILCADIGERRAGTSGERRAAEFIAQEWSLAGLRDVRLESFPCTSMTELGAEVQAPAGGRGWKSVEARALVGTPPTEGRKAIEAPLVWLEMPEAAHRLRPGSLRGKILGLFGPLPTDAVTHQKLVRAAPIAVIHIDERLPFAWAKNDGMYPYWVRRYGVRPTLTVPYLDAWRWRAAGVDRLRVRVIARPQQAESQNVIGEIPGRDPRLPAIALSAHHDTQCNNVGADDNGSGVVMLLALARRLAGARPRPQRTIRFVSFGTEEQLSVGSAAYVKDNRISRRDTALVVNFDSGASPLGHFVLWIAGHAALEGHVTRRLAARGVDVQVRREISPFFDHFPFNRVGIPSVTFMRENFPGGRWQHHSAHDNLQNIAPSVLQSLVDACVPLIGELANARALPFPTTLPAEQQATARKLGRDLLGE